MTLKLFMLKMCLDEKLKPFDFPAGEYEYTSTFGDVPQKATIKVDGSTLTVTIAISVIPSGLKEEKPIR